MNKEFAQELNNGLRYIEADYEVEKPTEKFAVWVGEKIFGYTPNQIIDELLRVSNGRFALIGEFDHDTRKLVLIFILYRNRSQDTYSVSDIQEVLGQWNDVEKHSETNKDWLESLNEDGLGFDLLQYIVIDSKFDSLVENYAAENDLQLMDDEKLRTEFYRRRHPLSLPEPHELEVEIGDNEVLRWPEETNIFIEDIQTIICPISLSTIHDWVSKYENGLFSANLRFRLPTKNNEIDREIQETIRMFPDRVFVQNNGITITCRKIEENEGKITLKKPQIVNGCQTSWAIHTAIERSEEEQKGFVLAKIIETDDEALMEAINTSSNKQNPIQPKDLYSKQPVQKAISGKLFEHTEDSGIFWDYRSGGWEQIESDEEKSKHFLIKGTRSSFRKLPSQIAGQAMLAMIGAVQDAKNQGGKIHQVEKLYTWAFRYDLPDDKRFSGLSDPTYIRADVDYPLESYIKDLLFAYAIRQYTSAIYKSLYSQRIKLIPVEKRNEILAQTDFVKYWIFDVIRLLHLLVNQWVETSQYSQEEIRQSLIGDLNLEKFLDPLFLTDRKRSEIFNMEEDWRKPNILSISDPTKEQHLEQLCLWFKNLEELMEEVVVPKAAGQTFSFMMKRKDTHDEMSKKLESLFKRTRWMQLFPLSNLDQK